MCTSNLCDARIRVCMQSLDHQRSKYVWILKNRTHIDWGKWLAGESRPREPVVPLVYGLLAVKIVGGHRDRHKKVGGRFVYPVSQSRAHSRRDKLLGRSGVSTFSFTDDKGDEKTTHDPPRVNRILSSLYKKQRTSAHSRTHTPYFSLQSTPRLHISFFFSLLFLEPLHYFFYSSPCSYPNNHILIFFLSLSFDGWFYTATAAIHRSCLLCPLEREHDVWQCHGSVDRVSSIHVSPAAAVQLSICIWPHSTSASPASTTPAVATAATGHVSTAAYVHTYLVVDFIQTSETDALVLSLVMEYQQRQQQFEHQQQQHQLGSPGKR